MAERGEDMRPEEVRLSECLVARVAIDCILAVRIVGKVVDQIFDGGKIQVALSAVYRAVFCSDEVGQAGRNR